MITNITFRHKTVLYSISGLILSLTSCLWLSNISAQTADTPWPMFRQNPQHTGQRDINADSNEPQIAQKKYEPIKTGIGFVTDITSSPSIASDGTVFIGSLANGFFAIDPDSGAIIGTFTTFNSVFSSPAIGKDKKDKDDNHVIFVGSWDGIIYELQFDKNEPDTKKRFKLKNFVQSGAEDFGHLSGIVVDGDVGGAIAGASVVVGGKGAFTGSDGTFFVDNILKGTHQVTVSAGGKDCNRTFTAEICGFQNEQNAGNVTLHDFVIIDVVTGATGCPEVPEINIGGCDGIIASKEQTDIEDVDFSLFGPDEIGKLRTFNHNLLIERGVACSPLIGFNNWVYWGSQNHRFYGWNVDSGRIFFKELGGPIVASPAQSLDGTVYVITLNGELHAFNPDFSKVIGFPFVADGQVTSSPAIGQDGTIYFGAKDNNLYAVQPNGRLKWKFPTGGFIVSSTAIDRDGTIYIGSGDGNLYAIEDSGVGNPVAKWKFPAGSEIAGSSPSIGKDGVIYIGISGEFPKILAITRDGFLKWCIDTINGVTSTPAIASNGTIFAGSFDGLVYALENKIGNAGTFKISGKVINSKNSAPIEGAAVELTKIIGGGDIQCEDPFAARSVSDSGGLYQIEGIPSGSYDITASHKDFKNISENNVIVTGDIADKDFALDPKSKDGVEIISVSFDAEKDPATCFPLLVRFSDTSSVSPQDTVIDYSWNFGDGGSSNLKNPEHEYTETGLFTVELRINAPGTNAGSSTSGSVSVKEPPCARFKPVTIKVKPGEPVNFSDLSVTSESEEITRREWAFSFNRPLQQFIVRRNRDDLENTAHEFFGSGDHSVSLFIQQSDGKDDKAFGTVTVVNKR